MTAGGKRRFNHRLGFEQGGHAIGLKFRRNLGGVQGEKLVLILTAQHGDRCLIAIQKPLAIQQGNGVGGLFIELTKRGF